ncbi:hypothetical protein WICPIJ_006453 [Wickerhamomyces pijperi]|uniref:Uncharacterized protein n=1 Tax=Wickerhamomyces pijperi TaxID=599730 RepID=A0A9P8TK73_WICPI|nr:hypothetical protein WICPIJ_006453 [Wickerhamomyces pijperi]
MVLVNLRRFLINSSCFSKAVKSASFGGIVMSWERVICDKREAGSSVDVEDAVDGDVVDWFLMAEKGILVATEAYEILLGRQATTLLNMMGWRG